MALKRKLDSSEDMYPINTKQIKHLPFPSADNDVDMSDAASFETEAYHSRLNSTASSLTSASSPAASPADLYSETNVNNANFISSSSGQSVGLFQPKSIQDANPHRFCTQIPKLKVACASGPYGRRKMWTHCEECGSVEMVDSD